MLDVSKVLAAAKTKKNNDSVKMIRLCDLSVDESQPRSVFDEQSLIDLATDIEQNGLLQPILVREVSSDKYMIIAGERRYRAFSLLNMQEIPCIVKGIDVDNLSNIGYLQMSENLKRDNLRFYEVAEFIQSRVDSNEPKGEIAKRLGMSQKDVTHYLSWGKAPNWLKSYKNRFTAAKPFYEYVQFASKQDEEALKEFMQSCEEEKFTASMLKRLKAQAVEEEESAGGAAVDSVNDATHDTASAEAFNDQSDDSDDAIEDSNEGVESADSSEESFEDDDVQFFTGDEEHSSDERIDDEDIDATDESNTGSDIAEYAISDSSTDKQSESSDTQDDHYKKPIILGYVDGREAELLYKTKPQSDGFVWVKYEDGSLAEALAEQFTLNRIIEG